MRIAAEIAQQTLHHGQDQLFVTLTQSAEEGLVRGLRPERGKVHRLFSEVEGPATEHPSFHKVGVDVAGFLDREVALVHGSETLGAEAHLLGQSQAREHRGDALLRLVVPGCVDAVAFEDREADAVKRLPQLLRELPSIIRVPVQEAADVTGRELVLVVERLVRTLRQVIGLRLRHLVVPDVLLIRRDDAVILLRSHA